MSNYDNIDRLISKIFDLRKLIHDKAEKSRILEGCSFVQLIALRFIAGKVRPTMHDVADYLGVTPPSATSIIDKLIDSGYVKRMEDKEDRRVVRLSMTAVGQKKLSAGFGVISGEMRKVLLKLDVLEQTKLDSILEKLVSQVFN